MAKTSSLGKAMSGAMAPDAGEILLQGKPEQFNTPTDARGEGIETVDQTLAMSPALSIADNMPHIFEMADHIHGQRLGKRLCKIDPKDDMLSNAVAYMTGTKEAPLAA